jgi:hypothetical protein
MITGFDKPIMVGLVFDMDDFKIGSSFAHKEVKRSLIKFAQKIGMNCRMYVSGNEKLPSTCGETVQQIFSYQSSKDMGKFGKKMSDCLSEVGFAEESSKYIFVLTNRYVKSEMYQYKKSLKLNEDKSLGCKFVFFEMGRHTVELQELVGAYESAEYHPVNSMEYFDLIIKKILEETGNG